MTRIFCDACEQPVAKEDPPLKPLAILATDDKRNDLCRSCQDRIRQIVRHCGWAAADAAPPGDSLRGLVGRRQVDGDLYPFVQPPEAPPSS